MNDVLPSINAEFTLITHHGDESVTNEFLEIANHPKLKHWFAQNNELNHPKITAIPIGLEDAWRHNNGIVRDFKKLIQNPVTKKPRILYGFNVLTNPDARTQALEVLTKTKLAIRVDLSSRKYRETLNQYMFVASPPGNGIDCHRTWEALYLKTIPIVVGHDFYNQFSKFPGLVLNSWDELMSLDEQKLIKIYRQKIDILSNYPLIWETYWRNLINESRLKICLEQSNCTQTIEDGTLDRWNSA
jgi:hypothetical protein